MKRARAGARACTDSSTGGNNPSSSTGQADPKVAPSCFKRTSLLRSRQMWWCLIFASHRDASAPLSSCSSYPSACLDRQSSSTRRSKIRPARLGASGDWTHDRLPRAAAWPDSGALSTPRNSTGINEYLYSLSLRWPDAVRCSDPGVILSALLLLLLLLPRPCPLAAACSLALARRCCCRRVRCCCCRLCCSSYLAASLRSHLLLSSPLL